MLNFMSEKKKKALTLYASFLNMYIYFTAVVVEMMRKMSVLVHEAYNRASRRKSREKKIVRHFLRVFVAIVRMRECT